MMDLFEIISGPVFELELPRIASELELVALASELELVTAASELELDFP